MKIKRHYSKKPIDDAQFKRLWSTRISDCALAKMMGCHPWTMRRRAIKLGLPLRRKIWADTS